MPESALCVSESAEILLPTFKSTDAAEAWYFKQMREIKTIPCEKLKNFLTECAKDALQAAYM